MASEKAEKIHGDHGLLTYGCKPNSGGNYFINQLSFPHIRLNSVVHEPTADMVPGIAFILLTRVRSCEKT